VALKPNGLPDLSPASKAKTYLLGWMGISCFTLHDSSNHTSGVMSRRTPFHCSQFHLNAQFDDLSGGELEVAGGGTGKAAEEDEETLAPVRHGGLAGGQEKFA